MKDSKDLKIGERKGNPGNDHWEMHIKGQEWENDNPALSFRPGSGTKRAQPHQKVNECDH